MTRYSFCNFYCCVARCTPFGFYGCTYLFIHMDIDDMLCVLACMVICIKNIFGVYINH